jgi:hypothetical protein
MKTFKLVYLPILIYLHFFVPLIFLILSLLFICFIFWDKFSQISRIDLISFNVRYLAIKLLLLRRCSQYWALAFSLWGSLILHLQTVGRTPWTSDQPVAGYKIYPPEIILYTSRHRTTSELVTRSIKEPIHLSTANRRFWITGVSIRQISSSV